MAQIFISYRRSDSQANTDRIYVELVKAFGRKAIFKDVDDIPPGVDFPNYLQDKVQDAKIVLIIIGRQWATVAYEDGSLRLHDTADFVRIEVELALSMGNVLVIPVLVNNASMPISSQLPASIRSITRLNAMQVRNDPDFFNDSSRLIRKLKELGIGKQTNYVPFIGSGFVFVVVMLIAFIFTNNFLNLEDNTVEVEPTTQVALVSSDTLEATLELSEAAIVTNDIRVTGGANAYITLTPLAPTDTPTIPSNPTDTPISSNDIQNTEMAIVFEEATFTAITATSVALTTERAVQTQHYVVGETATSIFQLSLTPLVTDTATVTQSPSLTPPIPTSTPTIHETNVNLTATRDLSSVIAGMITDTPEVTTVSTAIWNNRRTNVPETQSTTNAPLIIRPSIEESEVDVNIAVVLDAFPDLHQRDIIASQGSPIPNDLPIIITSNVEFLKPTQLIEVSNTNDIIDSDSDAIPDYLTSSYNGIGYGQIVYSHDGSRLAVVAGDIIEVWNVTNERLIFILSGHNNFINDIVFNEADTLLVSASSDGSIIFWNLDTGIIMRRIYLATASFSITSSDFINDDKILVITVEDYIVFLTVESANNGLCRTASTNANSALRYSPDANNSPRGTLYSGTTSLIVGKVEDADGLIWYQLIGNNFWIGEDAISVIGNCENIPVIDE